MDEERSERNKSCWEAELEELSVEPSLKLEWIKEDASCFICGVEDLGRSGKSDGR